MFDSYSYNDPLIDVLVNLKTYRSSASTPQRFSTRNLPIDPPRKKCLNDAHAEWNLALHHDFVCFTQKVFKSSTALSCSTQFCTMAWVVTAKGVTLSAAWSERVTLAKYPQETGTQNDMHHAVKRPFDPAPCLFISRSPK